MKALMPILFVLSAYSTTLRAADLTGAWTLELNPDFGGVRDAVDCTFRQDGDTLRVDCGGSPISGEIKGERVTLRVTTGPKNEYTAVLVGELDRPETTIAGTWQLTDDTGKRGGKFTARKH